MELVRLQLLSCAQDELAFDLLRFLEPMLPPHHGTSQVRAWAKGWTKKNAQGIDSVLQLLAEQPANEVEIDFGVAAPYKVHPAQLTFHSLRCRIVVSPTNRLWSPVKGFVLSTAEDESRRATYESRELSLKWNEVTAFPTLVDAVFEVSDEGAPEPLLRSFYEVLPRVLPTSSVWDSASGCADLLSLTAFSSDVLDALSPWPLSYPLLGKQFDDLHPILLGRESLCDGLAYALGNQPTLHRLADEDSKTVLAVLFVPTRLIADPETRDAARPWLVPRDDTRRPKPLDEAAGEFRVGSRVLYTSKRQRELEQQGRLATLRPGLRYFPLISAKYCTELGIDPDNVPVQLWQESLIEKVQLEIDRQFRALPAEMPLIERLWRAHEVVYRKWLYRTDAELAFLRERVLQASRRS